MILTYLVAKSSVDTFIVVLLISMCGHESQAESWGKTPEQSTEAMVLNLNWRGTVEKLTYGNNVI